MRYLYFIVIVLAFISCRKEIELDQPAYTSKIVVDGYIEQGKPASIFLTLSSPFLTHYDSVSISKSFLNYAKVTLVASDGEEEILTLFRQNQFFPPFVYKSVVMQGKVGLSYTLIINVKGKELRATTTIPEPPNLKGVRFNHVNDSMGYLEYLVEPREDVSYVFAQVRSMKVDKNFHPTSNPMLSIDVSQNNWIRLWRSRENMIYLLNPENYYYTNAYHRYQYVNRDTIWLKVGCVDRASFKVLLSMFVDITNKENPFAFNGSSMITNIEGGIGRWTGIATAPVAWVCGSTKPVQMFE
jgi:hypothetical protein